MTSLLYRKAQKLIAYREAMRPLEKEFLAALLTEVKSRRGAAKLLAHNLGISEQYLSDVCKGRRDVSDAILTAVVEAGR
jgi:DNA-binding phage protein